MGSSGKWSKDTLDELIAYGCLQRSMGVGLPRFGVFQQGFIGKVMLEITTESYVDSRTDSQSEILSTYHNFGGHFGDTTIFCMEEFDVCLRGPSQWACVASGGWERYPNLG